jgi:hypothetical protein
VPRFEKTLQVSAPAERAWEVIGDLTLMGRLAGATEVKVDEMTRCARSQAGRSTISHGHQGNPWSRAGSRNCWR